METNYIKISTAITKSWIFNDTNYFKWWVDMLTMAAVETHEEQHEGQTYTIQQGQFVASIRALAKRWNKSRWSIDRFLKQLLQQGIIKIKKLSNRGSLFIICNYKKYITTGNKTDHKNQNVTEYKTNSYTPFEEVKAITTSHRKVSIKEKEKKEKRKEAKENRKLNKNKIIYYSSTATAYACTREGEIQKKQETRKRIMENNGDNLFLSQERQNEILEELKENQIFVEAVCMNLHLTYLDVRNKLNEFQREINAKLTKHRDERQLRQHAYDWIRINKLKQNNGNTYSDTEAAAKRNREVREYVANLLKN